MAHLRGTKNTLNIQILCTFITWSVLVFACQSKESLHNGKLTVLADTTAIIGDLTEGMDGGGLKSQQQKAVQWLDLSCIIENENVRVSTQTKGASLTVVPQGIGLPADWKPFSDLQVMVENTNTENLELILSVKGRRNVLSTTKSIAPNKKETISLSLHDLGLTALNFPVYEPNSFTLEIKNAENVEFLITNIGLLVSASEYREPVSDAFGQRVKGEWPEKIKDESELIKLKEEESQQLQHKAAIWKDKYGGWADGPTLPAKGFFYVTEHNGKWWYVTPNGSLFWSLGVTGIRPKELRSDVTLVKGREELFAWLPEKDGPYAEVWVGGEAVSFYHTNLLRKYGNLNEWRITVLKRLKNWGLNSIGNWSEEALLMESDVPFTYSFRTTFEGLNYGHGISDVFDPEWERKTDSVLASASKFKDNPYLIGYFVDNEAGWGTENFIDIFPTNCATRYAWEEHLKQKYKSPEAVCIAWDIPEIDSWEKLRNLKLVDFYKNENQHADIEAFEIKFAEQYFKTVTETLHKYDPNHLYMSCRFTRKLKPLHILEVAGKYSDVVTVNVYAYAPIKEEMDAWYAATKKPILIGEHHVALQSERQHPPHWQAFTAEERNEYYKAYVKTWAQFSYSLGSHWYQFADQPITGRLSDGENQVVGLVDITDQPHRHLIDAISVVSDSVYVWHHASSR